MRPFDEAVWAAILEHYAEKRELADRSAVESPRAHRHKATSPREYCSHSDAGEPRADAIRGGVPRVFAGQLDLF